MINEKWWRWEQSGDQALEWASHNVNVMVTGSLRRGLGVPRTAQRMFLCVVDEMNLLQGVDGGSPVVEFLKPK